MTTEQPSHPALAAGGLASGLAAIWTLAAAIRPTATFHLAPILISLAPLLPTGSHRPISSLAGASTAVIALGTSLGLAATGLLRGPSLLPFGGALTEAVIFAVAGVAAVITVSRFGARRTK